MQILIKQNAYCEHVKNYAGEWLRVDTQYLFSNQYNTLNGMRVTDADVQAVRNDERAFRAVCSYDGTNFNAGEICPKCNGEHPAHNFTAKNTYFLAYPDGMKNKTIPVSNHAKIGTYFFSLSADQETYYLHNMRQSIRFKYDGEQFAIFNQLGWKLSARLPIPAPAFKQLLTHLQQSV